MKLQDAIFRRKYSVNPYKNLTLKVYEMSMFKDWVNDNRGDPYTVFKMEGDVSERIDDASYIVSSEKGGEVCRMLGDFFPYYSYDIELGEFTNCKVGIRACAPDGIIEAGISTEGYVYVKYGEEEKRADCKAEKGDVFTVNFRGTGISLYINKGRRPVVVADFDIKAMDDLRFEEKFTATKAALFAVMGEGSAFRADKIEAYLCGANSHADMKPVKYEDGTPIIENGRVYMSMSSRIEVGAYQSIISFNPTLCDFKLEGALFFDSGNGKWCNDVASSIVFDRNTQEWLIWVCTFNNGHVPARGVTFADPRFGIQVIDVKPLEKAAEDENRCQLKGFKGDEDPDLCLIDGKWHLTICRLEPGDGYHYYHFISDDPFENFEFVDRTRTGGKTGGLITKFEDEYYFVCGTDFNSRANYDIYALNDFSVRHKLQCDYDDGGFRGWGTIFKYPFGSRKKYYWVTFDRHNSSAHNWSYGNIYVYEVDVK